MDYEMNMDSSTTPNPDGTPDELHLHIDGMTCGSCVARVERALRNVPNVRHVAVNLATAAARVQVDSQAATEPLIAAVRNAGYGATIDRGTWSAGLELTAARMRLERHRRTTALTWAASGWAVILALSTLAPPVGIWRFAPGLVCAVLLVCPAGRTVLAGGLRALRHAAPNMDALVTIGVGTAFAASACSLLFGETALRYFDTVGMILMFISAGKLLEAIARDEAGRSVADLVGQMPRVSTCLRDGEWQETPIDSLLPGDRVRVVPDGVVPVDGRIVKGAAALDESMMTGESIPKHRTETDTILGGTIVREGVVEVVATGVGRETALGRIIQAVAEAQMGKTNMQRLADRVAGVFVPIVIACAIATAAFWLLTAEHAGDWDWALRCAVAVLVIACPCAMGLATPTAVLVATGRGAKAGILVRSPAALEAAGRADIVLFDKTGTLTTGTPVVEKVYDEPVRPETLNEKQLLQLAASAEQYSTHPLGKAILAKAREWCLDLIEPTSFEVETGRGVRASIGERAVLVGSASWVHGVGVDISTVQERIEQSAALGRTVAVVAVDGVCAGIIALGDQVRPDAAATISMLTGAGCKVGMVTGDSPETARAVAAQVNIPSVFAAMLPEDKHAQVRRLQQKGQTVAFVGDGSNDAPALAAADVGIAFAAGTDLANVAADITLVGNDLRTVAAAIQLSRQSLRIIKQNLFWAFFYNLLALPAAAMGVIPPGLAAAAMMFSSISVVLNALRLRKA